MIIQAAINNTHKLISNYNAMKLTWHSSLQTAKLFNLIKAYAALINAIIKAAQTAIAVDTCIHDAILSTIDQKTASGQRVYGYDLVNLYCDLGGSAIRFIEIRDQMIKDGEILLSELGVFSLPVIAPEDDDYSDCVICPCCQEWTWGGSSKCDECGYDRDPDAHICNNCGGDSRVNWHEHRVAVDDYRCWKMPAHYTSW